MIKSFALLAAAGLTLAMTQPAVAQDTATSAEQPAKEKKVCKTQPPAVGSRLGARRVCRTQAEWDEQQQNARDTANDMSQRGQLEGTSGPNG
ncbi:hypothetical protein [Qipengyuania marisflavi]|uniref:Uncharacterized protein n=1 Tax=Qipengyuania marisflavi TaxID=2486356 RepID=A0A5S3P8R4_9SPHN|nr:hypothetical protein [Qipengyuania marisflavi]TMM49816.1 hypothetical protein FEV51_01040 [Qipengyuania marisflavi]